MKHIPVHLFFFLFLANTCLARPISVNLIKLLKESEKILKIKVISIEDRLLKYQNLKTQSIDSVFTHGSKKGFSPTDISGTLPVIGDTVVIVVTKFNFISLYAKKIGTYYRFWSPYVANSSTLFFYPRPFQKLSNETESKEEDFELDDDQEYFSCYDGCLLRSKYFELRNGSYRKDGFRKFIKKPPFRKKNSTRT